MAEKQKRQFDTPDQVKAKAEMDKLVRGGMNYISITIAKEIAKIIAELEKNPGELEQAEGFKRGLITAQHIAEAKIITDLV